jgi:hypothetical protein
LVGAKHNGDTKVTPWKSTVQFNPKRETLTPTTPL